MFYPEIPYFSLNQSDSLYGRHVESQFEAAHPEIDLVLLDSPMIADFYSDRDLYDLSKSFDIMEIDYVMLPNLVREGALHKIDFHDLDSSKFLEVAIDASHLHGDQYGVPHFLCTNFLFSLDDSVLGIESASDLQRFVTKLDRGPIDSSDTFLELFSFYSFACGKFNSATYRDEFSTEFDKFSKPLIRYPQMMDGSSDHSQGETIGPFLRGDVAGHIGYSHEIESIRKRSRALRADSEIYAQPLCLNEDKTVLMFAKHEV